MHAVLWMLSSCAAFSVVGAFVKVAHRLPAYEIAFFRSFVNVILLTPWFVGVLRKQGMPAAWKKDYKFVLLRGFSGTAAMVLYFYSITHLRLADAFMLNYSSPVPTLFLSWLFLGERLTRGSVAFMLVAIVGVALLLKPSFDVASLAGIAGFASSLAAAVAYVSIKAATRSFPTSFIVISFASVASLVNLVPMILGFVMPNPTEWLCLISMGAIATFAQQSMTIAYQRLPASIASPLMLVTVLMSAVIGWVFWGEVPDRWALSGGLLIGIGLIGVYRFKAKPAPVGAA